MEGLFFRIMKSDCDISPVCRWSLIIAFVFWLIPIVIGGGMRVNVPYSFNFDSLAKLLASTLAKANVYSISVLLVFLYQFALSSDVVVDLIKGNLPVCQGVVLSGVAVIVLILIGFLFPVPKQAEIKNEDRKILLSGFSTNKNKITDDNLELALKPIPDGNNQDCFAIEEWVILPSKELCKAIFEIPRFIEKDNVPSEFKDAIDTYNSSVNSSNTDSLSRFSEIIKRCIEIKSGRTITVKCLNSVDYNDFDECYNRINKEIGNIEKEYENRNHKKKANAVIHTSPGTAIVSAVMTAFSIKSDRQLVYTRQDDRNLSKVNVSILSLKDVFEELSRELE